MPKPLRSLCERAICGTAMDNLGRLVGHGHAPAQEIGVRDDAYIRAGLSQ